jgi:hypothetical protein
MRYFKYFPKLQYDLDANGQTRTIVDTFRFAKIVTDFKDDITFYRFYDIQEGERPDHVSQKLYGTPNYYWTFFLCNSELKSLENDWPVESNELEEKLKHKYPNKVLTINTNDFHSKFEVNETINGLISGASATYITKDSNKGFITIKNVTGTFSNGEIIQGQTSSDTATIGTQINELQAPHHYEKDGFHVTRGTAGSSEVTNLQYEQGVNDGKKKIKVIRPELISDVASQFRSIVSG